MKGIILKDFYESFCIRKNLIGLLFSILCIGLVVIGMDNLYALTLMIVVTLLMTGSSTLQYSMEQDEISQYNKILLTYPLTKREIVKAKLTATYILSAIVNLFVSLPITLIYVYGYHTVDIKTGMMIWFLGIIVSLIMNAMNSIGFFWLGNKKGTILYIIILIAFVIFYIYSYFFVFDYQSLLNFGITNLLIVGFVIGILCNYLSYRACVHIYTKKSYK